MSAADPTLLEAIKQCDSIQARLQSSESHALAALRDEVLQLAPLASPSPDRSLQLACARMKAEDMTPFILSWDVVAVRAAMLAVCQKHKDENSSTDHSNAISEQYMLDRISYACADTLNEIREKEIMDDTYKLQTLIKVLQSTAKYMAS